MESSPRELKAVYRRKKLKDTATHESRAELLASIHNGLMPRTDGQPWTAYQFGKKEPAAFRDLREKVQRIREIRAVTPPQYPAWAEPTEEQSERTRRRAGVKK